MRISANSIWRNESGAIASIYALVLPALIVSGGVAFDYTRMAAMDTELQNAADQAALAAASQLDGQSGATQRAENAASALVANNTVFSNDGNGVGVGIAEVTFFSCESDECRADRDPANMVVVTRDDTSTSDDSAARYVEVTVGSRRAFYALTPIVGAISSGNMDATAMAGLGSAVCKVPPVMFCNPTEAVGGGGDFDAEGNAGAGLRLISGAPNFPGNFGFLDNEGGNDTPDLARALGHDTPPGNCSAIDDVGVTPGNRDVVFNAFNTRFDIDTNGTNTCPSGGACSAAINTRKDLVRRNQCGTSGNNAWQQSENPYRPTSLTPLTSGYPDMMGHPRDICHAVSENGVCDSNGDGATGDLIGNKIWDWDAYFRVNYSWDRTQWTSATGLTPNSDATRYNVYKWELENPPAATQAIGSRTAHNAPICRAAASPDIPDRRRVSAAVVNCREQNPAGNTTVRVLKWVDLFLVEPAFTRRRTSSPSSEILTTDGQVYVEIIGETKFAGGDEANQVVRRDVPYLIE